MSTKKVNIGAAVLEPGSIIKNKTGSWRVLRPVVDKKKCDGSALCWIFCPDNAIEIKNGKAVVDYDFCKGCGICCQVCPKKAIKMIKEEK